MVEMIQSGGPLGFCGIQFGQRMEAGGLPGLIPRGFVEGGVGFGSAILKTQAEAEIVVGFAVVGIRIAAGQPFDGLAEVFFGGDESSGSRRNASCQYSTGERVA